MKIPKEGQMYQNPIMELLSYSSPQMMIPFHLTLIFAMLYLGYSIHFINEIWVAVLIFVVGFFFWTFAEYVLHRWVFHYISESKIVQNFHYAVHGYHHSVPRDANRLFMPPVPAFLILALFFGFFYIFMGEGAYFFLPGFELGYLVYSLFHYFIHTKKPPKRWKKLWRHHSLHHYQYPNLAFGVSNTFWDRVFGTMPPERKKGIKK